MLEAGVTLIGPLDEPRPHGGARGRGREAVAAVEAVEATPRQDKSADASAIDNLLDEDLMDIYAAIRDGATTPAEALELDDAPSTPPKRPPRATSKGSATSSPGRSTA